MADGATAARRLINDDQGVCPNGHSCALVLLDGNWRRLCYPCDYIGMPIIADDVRAGDLIDAASQGVPDDLLDWAGSAITDRANR